MRGNHLQVEIAAAGQSIVARTLHRTISSALRTARSAPCRDFAISIKAAGLAPLRPSQRRSASQAISDPSRCRNRIMSTSERSGEYKPTAKPSPTLNSPRPKFECVFCKNANING
jgi:hypothetical protein